CSNSAATVDAYHLVPGNRNIMWPSYATGGGDVTKWADPASSYWSAYSSMVSKHGQPRYVWVQMCERDGLPANYDVVLQIISNLRTRTPNAILIASGLNDFDPNPGLCPAVGPLSGPGNSVYDTNVWADQLVLDGIAAVRGPYLGPLTIATTVTDHCHPNAAGETLLGSQFEPFIDAL